jgi:DNA (cytosine-5)-methyltransferase 1
MRVVDVFCGAGGWSEGLRQSGCDIVAGIDHSYDCCLAYASNQTGEAHQLDLLSEDGVEQAILLCRGADMIVGSPPCQSYSQANVHRGSPSHIKEYERTNNVLAGVFARIVGTCAPRCVAFEQVPLFRHSTAYAELVGLLGTTYILDVDIVNTAAYGVPQARRRLIVIGVRKDLPGALPPPPPPLACVSIAEAFAAQQPVQGPLVVGGTLRRCEQRHDMQVRGSQPSTWRHCYRALDMDRPAPTLTCSAHKPGCYGVVLREGRFHRLSLQEAACLMGFPLRYVFTGITNSRFKQVGNAVPPPLARAVGKRLLAWGVLSSPIPTTAKRKRCIHDKQKKYCRLGCGGWAYCVHGKQKAQCRQGCGGSSFCVHGKTKQYCREGCGGSIYCIHGKAKQFCRQGCGGAAYCRHGTAKRLCRKGCGGQAYCPHGVQKSHCRMGCGGPY